MCFIQNTNTKILLKLQKRNDIRLCVQMDPEIIILSEVKDISHDFTYM